MASMGLKEILLLLLKTWIDSLLAWNDTINAVLAKYRDLRFLGRFGVPVCNLMTPILLTGLEGFVK